MIYLMCFIFWIRLTLYVHLYDFFLMYLLVFIFIYSILFLMLSFWKFSYDLFFMSIRMLICFQICLICLYWSYCLFIYAYIFFLLLLFILAKDRSFIVYGSILYYVLFVCSYVYTIKSIFSLYFSFTFLNLSKRKLFLSIASFASCTVPFSINTIVLLPGRSSSGEYGTP